MTTTRGSVWLDGQLVPPELATVPLMTHALHYGSAVFEGIRSYQGRSGCSVFRLDDHLQRLARSATAYRITLPYTLRELSDAVLAVVGSHDDGDLYVRPIVFRGAGSMGLDAASTRVSCAVMAWPLPDYFDRGSASDLGARVTISRWRRIPPDALIPRAKAAGHYLNSSLALADARDRGFDEAIMLDQRGLVCEASAMNVLAVSCGVIRTPGESAYVLDGITRATVLELAADLDIEVDDSPLSIDELRLADELLLTGTGARLVPVRELDGRVLPAPGPVTKALSRAFEAAVRGHLPAKASWLRAVREPLDIGV